MATTARDRKSTFAKRLVEAGYDDVEVARIDTAHGETNFDELYRRDEPKEPLDVDLREAIDRLETNRRTYATSYERTHRNFSATDRRGGRSRRRSDR